MDLDCDQMLTLTDAARVLRVSVRTLFRIRQTGQISYVQVGRRYRFTPEQIEQYIRKSTVKPPQKQESKPKQHPDQARALKELAEIHGIKF